VRLKSELADSKQYGKITKATKTEKSHAKTQRFGLSDSSCFDALALGVVGELRRGPASALEVVNDSVDTVFQEIFTEVDQEA